MGRELKRVPLNFKWDIGEIWKGYTNPHECHECNDCKGDGWSNEYNRLRDRWYSFEVSNYKPNPFKEGCRYNSVAWSNNLDKQDVAALLEADRLWDFTRVPITEEQKEIVRKKVENGGNSWLPFNNGYVPTPKEVNDWNLKTIGHDSINCSVVIEAKLKREGKSNLCHKCNGTGEDWKSKEAKELFENWKEYDPPKGRGFQLWSTTTEGHPMTPVFRSLEKLCEYCEENKVSVFGDNTATKSEWMEMLNNDFVYHRHGNMIFL